MNKKIKILIPLYLTLFSIGTQASAETETSYNAEILYAQDDNVNRSADPAGALDSTFVSGSFNLNLSHILNPASSIRLFTRAKYDAYQETDGLNQAEITIGTQYQHKPSAGFNKPTLLLDASMGITDSETDIRDSTVFNLGMSIANHWTTKLSTHLGLNTRLRESDSRVFDNRDLRFFINADLSFGNRSTTYCTLSYITGETVSTIDLNSISDETLRVIDLADQIEFDPAFGDNQIAYRVDADTTTATLGYNIVIATRQSMDVSARTIRSRINSNTDYETTQLMLSYMVNF
jgi:hypothetical protein